MGTPLWNAFVFLCWGGWPPVLPGEERRSWRCRGPRLHDTERGRMAFLSCLWCCEGSVTGRAHWSGAPELSRRPWGHRGHLICRSPVMACRPPGVCTQAGPEFSAVTVRVRLRRPPRVTRASEPAACGISACLASGACGCCLVWWLVKGVHPGCFRAQGACPETTGWR